VTKKENVRESEHSGYLECGIGSKGFAAPFKMVCSELNEALREYSLPQLCSEHLVVDVGVHFLKYSRRNRNSALSRRKQCCNIEGAGLAPSEVLA